MPVLPSVTVASLMLTDGGSAGGQVPSLSSTETVLESRAFATAASGRPSALKSATTSGPGYGRDGRRDRRAETPVAVAQEDGHAASSPASIVTTRSSMPSPLKSAASTHVGCRRRRRTAPAGRCRRRCPAGRSRCPTVVPARSRLPSPSKSPTVVRVIGASAECRWAPETCRRRCPGDTVGGRTASVELAVAVEVGQRRRGEVAGGGRTSWRVRRFRRRGRAAR